MTEVSDARTTMSREQRWGVRRAEVAFLRIEGGLSGARTARRGVRTALSRGSRWRAWRQQVECESIAVGMRGVGTGASRARTAMSRECRWDARRVEWTASGSDFAVRRGEVVSQSI